MLISSDFVSELRKNFLGEIRLDAVSRILYSTDASLYQIEPLGVVIPKNQDDLIAVMELAAKYKIPVLPRGSGSSLAGQAIGKALILDCSRYLDNITSPVDKESHTVTIEPGVILSNLNREAAKLGLMFGPDPASAERATIGGVIGNNATGAHSILYGMTVDHLISADVIMSDGSLSTWGWMDLKNEPGNLLQSQIVTNVKCIRDKFRDEIPAKWPKTWRNSAGYRINYLLPWSPSAPEQWYGTDYPPRRQPSEINLASLLAGSEGTLAVIRSATLNLVKKPMYTILGILQFNSISSACDTVPELLKHQPSAIELIPQLLIRLARSMPAIASLLGFVRGDPAAILVVEFSGDDSQILRKKVQDLSPEVLIAESKADQAKVWQVRKIGLGIFDSRPSSERPIAFIEDCAIPVENLGNFVRQVETILNFHKTEAAFYAHASAGCLHIRPILNMKTKQGIKDLRSISREVMLLVLSLGGSMSSEHGDGLARAEWLEETYGKTLLGEMEKIKRAADPDGLLNPKKMFNAQSMDENLRYDNSFVTHEWKPELNFERFGGLAIAIEQCNGQGVCRKQDGTMCPSFQATRDEIYSTRGRANLLRALISTDKKRLNDEQVKESLDLCLACKGCKVECPSSVDMARLKYEFLSHYYKKHVRPVRDYLFGYINFFAKYGAYFGGLFNWLADFKWIRPLIQNIFGISQYRSLPHFGLNKQKFKINLVSTNYKESCIFLPDTFTHYFEPNIEEAALEVLDKCGIKVKKLSLFGAGRTLLSKGFIESARAHCEKLLDEINKLDPSGSLQIIGLEPSEIYTLRDEIIDLLPERKKEIEKIVGRIWLIDEYLIRNFTETDTPRLAGRIDNSVSDGTTRVLVHGHCYQKAQPQNPDGFPIGLKATTKLLQNIGYVVEELNNGCCGMAGAFGYESEHYNLSMRIGEQNIFRFINKGVSNSITSVVAVGTSCRSQIIEGAGIEAQHSIILVNQKMKSKSLI